MNQAQAVNLLFDHLNETTTERNAAIAELVKAEARIVALEAQVIGLEAQLAAKAKRSRKKTSPTS